MKKILLLVIIIFSVFAFVGCACSVETTTTVATTTTERPGIANRDWLMENLFSKLPIYDDDTDTVYEQESIGTWIGDTSVCVYDKNDILFMAKSGAELCYIDVYLEEAGSVRTGFYMINITYIDTFREIYVDVYLYHYGQLFHENYETEYVSVSVGTVSEKISTLTPEDIREIIVLLGFTGASLDGDVSV